MLDGLVKWLNTLDSKEIYNRVIDHLPDLELLTGDSFQRKLAHHRWLVSFTFGDRSPASNEYKKLQAFLRNDHIQVGRVDCKDVLYNIVGFARDSVRAHVTTLRPDNFPSDRKEPWLVDFFAPWCPPCRALLPELRKASIQLAGQMKFGTLDCTIHQNLCSTLLSGQILVGSVDCQRFQSFCQGQNVRAYPEIRLYPGNTRQSDRFMSYNGWNRDAHSLRSWALSSLPRASVDLTPESFRSLVLSGQDHWTLKGEVRAGKVDCQAHHQTCQSAGITAYPTVRFYPYLGTRRHEHSGEHVNSRDADVIADIVRQRLQQLSPRLHSKRK
ncbi:hypothetical protein FQN60_001597, partial [Etheostoma spectabile]